MPSGFPVPRRSAKQKIFTLKNETPVKFPTISPVPISAADLLPPCTHRDVTSTISFTFTIKFYHKNHKLSTVIFPNFDYFMIVFN